ncbi:hypothetical protein CHS0354_025182, partial [Potamilus streckersoni]
MEYSTMRLSLDELQVLTGELPLHLRRTELILRYATRVLTHHGPHPTKLTILQCAETFNRSLIPSPPAAKKFHTLTTRLGLNTLQAVLKWRKARQ